MTCKKCGFETNSKPHMLNHYRWEHPKKNRLEPFTAKGLASISKKFKERQNKKFGEYVSFSTHCKTCNKVLTLRERQNKIKEKYFCSRSCANKREHSSETKLKISKNTSKALIEKLENDPEYFKSVTTRIKRFNSKSELEILHHLKEHYPNLKWKSGSILKIENERIVRDMWSDVRKICIEYDGIWHFKNIHNQLEEKQKKDKLLNKWCVENGYCLIRIDDKEYVKRKNEILQIVHQIVEDQTNFSSHFIYADDKFY